MSEGYVVIKDVEKLYGTYKAVNQVSISIPKGRIHGIIGDNGAGKTTLIKALVGIHDIDGGSIQVGGAPVYENKKVKATIGYVADENQYFKNYRLKDLIAFYQEVYPSFSLEHFERYNRVMNISLNKKITQLSKGMKMRVSLMFNLSIRPDVLVLDEPTSGLDVSAKKQILEWILEAVDDYKMTVFISSHHLSELERVCDDISIIQQGKITYQSSIDDLKEKVRKVQVVFEGEVPQNLELWEDVLHVEHIGSVYYIVTQSYNKAFIEKLQEARTKLIETIPLTLEEIFIYTRRKKEGE